MCSKSHPRVPLLLDIENDEWIQMRPLVYQECVPCSDIQIYLEFNNNYSALDIWRPQWKSGLTPQTTKARIEGYEII